MTLIQIVNMNERIKQLAEQCGFKSNPDIYDRNQSFDIPKFAELIVRECVREFVRKQPVSVNVSNRARHVFKHFGVEE